jgi:hypothetical protein
MMTHAANIILVTVHFLFLYTPAAAQVTTADLVGFVADSSGAAVIGASVDIENPDTHEHRTSQTDSAGHYEFTLLLPGRYSLLVRASHFKTSEMAALALFGGNRTRADISMELGEVTEVISVTPAMPMLHPESSTLSTTVSKEAVQDLPLATRNLISLLSLASGSSEASSINGLSSGQRPDDRRQSSSFSVNGQDDILNNMLIDGTDNNERTIGTIGVKPSIDAIEELSVQANVYTPETGRTPGAVVSVITKAGTNQLHGSLYEFFKNDKLNARNPFDAQPFAKAEYRQNDFGSSLGGPIVKDRVFFFGAYEGFRQITGVLNPILSTVPPRQQLDLGPQRIIDSDPQIPKGTRPDPIAMKLLELYPPPNIPSADLSAPNYFFDPNQTQFSHTADIRVDTQFSSKHVFYARQTMNRVNTNIPANLPSVDFGGVAISPGNGDYGFSGPAKDTAYNVQLNYIHIFTPRLLLELKAAYTRINNRSDSPNVGTNAATIVGFPKTVNFGPESSGLPLIDIMGLATLGDSRFLPLQALNNTFQYNGALTYLKGAHSLKGGTTLIRRQVRSVQSANANGAYSFGLNNDNNPLATFLAGAFTSVGRTNNLYTPDYRSWEPGFYFQDTWKVARRLTINYGLRYDVFTPFTEAHNHISNFDIAKNRLLVAGLDGVSTTAGILTDYTDIAPRLGFAISLAHNTVVHSGFGVSHFPGNFTSNAGLKNPPFTSVFAPNCASPLATLIQKNINGQILPQCSRAKGQPETLADGIPLPTPQNLNSPNLSLLAEQLNFRSGRMYQFNVVIERQFGRNVFSVGYVHNHGQHIPVVINNINVPNPTGLTSAEILSLTHPPTFNILPNISSVGFYESVGFSSYHSLQTTLQRQYGNGFGVSASYSWSHAIDDAPTLSNEGQQGFGNANPFDLEHIEKGNSDLDLRHRLSLAGSYQLPFGRSLKGLANIVMRGWQVNGIFVWNTGNPFTITDAFTGARVNVFDASVGAAGPNRPMQIAPASLFHSDDDQYFNRYAFVIPPPGVIGNVGRNSLYGPQFSHFDWSIFKKVALTEKVGLHIRAEVFNLTNTPSYFIANDQNHDATTNLVPTLEQVESRSVGLGFAKIVRTNPNYTPRQLQFAVKLLF